MIVKIVSGVIGWSASLIAPSLSLQMDDLSMSSDKRHRAGQLIGVYIPLHRVGDARQQYRRHADRFGFRAWKVGDVRPSDTRREQQAAKEGDQRLGGRP
jgi:Ni/Co efflux regulator RcnB